jgi:hypothetical protein
MICGDPDVPNITGSQALLTGGRFGEFERPDAKELILELIHPGGCEEYRRVVLWNQDIARSTDAAFGFKEVQILFTQLISFHIVHYAGFIARSKQILLSSTPLAADPRPAIFQNDGILEEKMAGFKAEVISRK